MSAEDERRAARAARRNGLELPKPKPLEPVTPPTTTDPTEALAQQLDALVDVALQQQQRARGPLGPGGLCVVAVDDGPPSGGGAPRVVDVGDVVATVRHDEQDVPSDGDGEVELPADGDRHVVDDGKAAGETMRRERQQRAGRAPVARHGHGWLEVESFTEHLRTTRLRPIGVGQGTVNVRVSAPLAEALEAYRGELEVSKRDVIEALLVELLGPAADGGRR